MRERCPPSPMLWRASPASSMLRRASPASPMLVPPLKLRRHAGGGEARHRTTTCFSLAVTSNKNLSSNPFLHFTKILFYKTLRRRDFINLSVLTAATGVISTILSCTAKETSNERRTSLNDLTIVGPYQSVFFFPGY